MDGLTVIFGYGVAGRAIAQELLARGRRLRIAQRSRPKDLPADVDFAPCDALRRDEVLQAAEGADRLIVAIGFAYDARLWAKNWPVAMAHFLAAAEASGAATLFFDNMYMYGPQDGPIREETVFAPWGGKPAARRAISDMWRSASAQGRVCMSALRVSDFYGPGVSNSHLGQLLFGRLAQGKSALFATPIDHPHDVAYLPDAARAMACLLDLPREEWGQVWLMPCAETMSFRQIAGLAEQAMGATSCAKTLPPLLLALLRPMTPVLRELHDVRFLFDRPYRIDGSKFIRRFGEQPTPLEQGVAETARHARLETA